VPVLGFINLPVSEKDSHYWSREEAFVRYVQLLPGHHFEGLESNKKGARAILDTRADAS